MTTTTEIMHISPKAIDPSPLNPRKHVGDVAELQASMRAVGILQPLTVRIVKRDRYELVLGERRLTAALALKMIAVPCVVREMTDQEVLEAQIVENSQRADVHPLDEADGFKALVGFGQSAAQIADKVGRSVPFVVQRLQLCHLSKKGRAAFDAEVISLGAAIVLARVPVELQDHALKAVTQGRYGDAGPISGKAAREFVENHYSHRLAGAPWKLDDATLVPAAGACTVCPKRTGNQRELFDDVKHKDTCTDPTCYRSKLDAVWQIRVARAPETGETIAEGKAADAVRAYNSGFVEVRGSDPYWTGTKEVPIVGVIKKSKLPITVVREHHGNAREFVREVDLRKALKLRDASASHSGPSGESLAKTKALARIENRTMALALEQAVAKVEKATKTEPLIALIVRAFAKRAWNDAQKIVLRRRGVELKPGMYQGAEKAIVKLCDEMTHAQRIGLGVELALVGIGHGTEPDSKAALKTLGIDVAKIQREVTAEDRERTKAKAARKAKADKKPAATKATKGVCTKCGCTESTPCVVDGDACAWANPEKTLCTACA